MRHGRRHECRLRRENHSNAYSHVYAYSYSRTRILAYSCSAYSLAYYAYSNRAKTKGSYESSNFERWVSTHLPTRNRQFARLANRTNVREYPRQRLAHGASPERAHFPNRLHVTVQRGTYSARNSSEASQTHAYTYLGARRNLMGNGDSDQNSGDKPGQQMGGPPTRRRADAMGRGGRPVRQTDRPDRHRPTPRRSSERLPSPSLRPPDHSGCLPSPSLGAARWLELQGAGVARHRPRKLLQAVVAEPWGTRGKAEEF